MTARISPNVNSGLWMVMVCPCAVTSCDSLAGQLFVYLSWVSWPRRLEESVDCDWTAVWNFFSIPSPATLPLAPSISSCRPSLPRPFDQTVEGVEDSV